MARGKVVKKVYIGEDKGAYMLVSRWIRMRDEYVGYKAWIWPYANSYHGSNAKCPVKLIEWKHKRLFLEQFANVASPIDINDDEGFLMGVLAGYNQATDVFPEPLMLESYGNDGNVRIWKQMGSVCTKEEAEKLFKKCRENGWKIANQCVLCGKCPYMNEKGCGLICGEQEGK